MEGKNDNNIIRKNIKADSFIGFIRQLLFGNLSKSKINNDKDSETKELVQPEEKNVIVKTLENANEKLDNIHHKIMNYIFNPKQTSYKNKNGRKNPKTKERYK